MISVILLHPEETFRVPAFQAITKCNLFQRNPSLIAVRYRLQSPVTLFIFRAFVCELEGHTVNIRDTNLTELQLLCEEFGFDEFAAKLSRFYQRSENSGRHEMKSSLVGVQSAHLSESFLSVVNGKVIESEVVDSAAVLPAVPGQLSVDGYARKVFLNVTGIEQRILALFNSLFWVNRFQLSVHTNCCMVFWET
jgi:hypothetical protein